MDTTLRHTHNYFSDCQVFKNWLPNDEAVVIQKVCLLQGIFKIIKIETLKLQQMSSRFSKLTSLHILEMFTSTFNSQETIVFLQSFAPKFLGPFIETVAMANEPWRFVLHSHHRSLLCPGSWLEQVHNNVIMCMPAWRLRPEPYLSYYIFTSQIIPQRSYDQISRGHTGVNNRTWNTKQAYYRLDRCSVCFTFYVKSLTRRKDLPRDLLTRELLY